MAVPSSQNTSLLTYLPSSQNKEPLVLQHSSLIWAQRYDIRHQREASLPQYCDTGAVRVKNVGLSKANFFIPNTSQINKTQLSRIFKKHVFYSFICILVAVVDCNTRYFFCLLLRKATHHFCPNENGNCSVLLNSCTCTAGVDVAVVISNTSAC